MVDTTINVKDKCLHSQFIIQFLSKFIFNLVTASTFINCPNMFSEKGVLKNFALFTGKHLCWSLFSIKLQSLNINFKEHLRAAAPVYL